MRTNDEQEPLAQSSGAPTGTHAQVGSGETPLAFDPRRLALDASAVLGLQRRLGNAAVSRLVSGGAAAQMIQRNGNGETDIQRLNEMLDRFNVPESEVIALIGRMNPGDKQTVAGDGYKGRIAAALNFSEMMQVVRALPLTLDKKLEWLNAAATFTSAIAYGEIRALVTAAPQPERDGLKTDGWKSFFVDVCDNATMVSALNDLGFDLQTKLTWLNAEMTVTSWELDYSTIRAWITAAPQPERDALKADTWKSFFVDVCDNATMVSALNDLGFDLQTKLTWLNAEMTLTRAELSYSTIRPWILAAPQPERDALNTPDWRAFFVEVCTDATMETAINDLGFKLQDKLRWLIAEGAPYESFKRVITAAGDKAAALGDQPFLLELKDYHSWNDFARCVELLGRTIPALLGDATVQAALGAAWTASNPAIVPAPPAAAPPGVHEEGGFIYLNIITNVVTTDRVAPGAQASLPLNNPSPPDDAITIGGYHTHPNVGPAWGAPFASGADTAWATRNGVPLLFRGAFPAVANVSDGSTGPVRLHLAGDRGFPGASGGLAPQATIEGEEPDEI